MKFSLWVKEKREAKRFTKVECAARAGVSLPTWIEYENTDKAAQPRRNTVVKIAEALGVSVSEAMEAAGYSIVVEMLPDVEITRMVNSLPVEKRNLFLAGVRGLYQGLTTDVEIPGGDGEGRGLR